jgi:ribosomal protein S18 acetylase RimI-like enzyme
MSSAAPTPSGASTPFTVSAATSADVAPIVALVNSAYRGEASRRGWTTEEHLVGGQRTDEARIALDIGTPGQVILLLREGSALCGCVMLEDKPDRTCYLGMLTVRPELQASGIGRRLLAAGEAWAAEHFGSQYVEMTVVELRGELIAWYERRGYRQTGEIRPFPYEDQRFGLPKRDDLRFVVLRRRIVP